jgi:hypothetical protein
MNLRKETTEKFETIVSACRAVGIKQCLVTFSGSNGRAFLNDILLDDAEPKEWAALEEMVSDWAWDLIADIGVDIHKDDGGCGTIEINMELGDYGYRVSQFYTAENLMAEKKVGTALAAVPSSE